MHFVARPPSRGRGTLRGAKPRRQTSLQIGHEGHFLIGHVAAVPRTLLAGDGKPRIAWGATRAFDAKFHATGWGTSITIAFAEHYFHNPT